MRRRTLHLTALVAIIFLVLLVAATLSSRGTRASPGTLYVATTGDDNNICDSVANACRTVQRAINLATTGDEIQVATGTYTDTAGTVAKITETITLKGGWNTAFNTQDPSTYPTTLDAQRQGRVIDIQDNYAAIAPTIEGFIITGGDATFASDLWPGKGGGIFIRDAAALIQNNVITNNIGMSTAQYGYGGGVYILNSALSASPVVSGNEILSNTASTGNLGFGGGVGAYGAVILSGNTINDNIGSTTHNGYGDGLYLTNSPATVNGNTISGNSAGLPFTGWTGDGGGVYAVKSPATLEGNRIISNSADYGGGVYIWKCDPITLTNNIIAWNGADYYGGGIHSSGYGEEHVNAWLINNTIAQNNQGSAKEGMYLSSPSFFTLTNNIIATHTYGISIGECDYSQVNADYTLFFNNTEGDTGPHCTYTNTNAITGQDPLFVNPAAWDYHIQVGSPAINSGTFNGAPAIDFEGDPRPYDCYIDIGADENTASDECKRLYLPLIMKNY